MTEKTNAHRTAAIEKMRAEKNAFIAKQWNDAYMADLAPRRVGWISPQGEFLGWSVPFGTEARAAYVEFKDNQWQEA